MGVNMSDVSVNEGMFGQAKHGNLIFPNINSCLAITYVYADGMRCGGHAILLPEGNQASIGKILEELSKRPTPKKLLIIGDIGTWDQNWQQLPSTNNLKIKGHALSKVSDIAKSLSIPAEDVITKDTNGVTYDVIVKSNGLFDLVKH